MTRTKREYEINICRQAKENPKRFWKHTRENLKTKTGVYPLLESANDETSLRIEDHEKAEILQQQFCRVFTKEPEGELPAFPPRTDKEVEINLTIKTVRKEILSINVNKAIGPDEIHPRMLKELLEYITIPLFIIIKKSLVCGILPYDWKLTDVSPIFKKGAKNLAENYRLLEKMIKDKIMNHLTQEKLLSSNQHGFVNGRSTVTQLLNYLDTAAEAIAEGKVVDLIYFDFAKAFDTIPHQRFLKKLEGYDIKNGLDHFYRIDISLWKWIVWNLRNALSVPYCLYCTSTIFQKLSEQYFTFLQTPPNFWKQWKVSRIPFCCRTTSMHWRNGRKSGFFFAKATKNYKIDRRRPETSNTDSRRVQKPSISKSTRTSRNSNSEI